MMIGTTAAVKAESLIRLFDNAPRLPIEKLPLEDSAIVRITFMGRESLSYLINSRISNQTRFNEIVGHTAGATRTRAQIENRQLELFPELGPREIGFFKDVVEELLVKEGSFEAIDIIVFSLIVEILFSKKALKLYEYRELNRLNASEIISWISDFFPKERHL